MNKFNHFTKNDKCHAACMLSCAVILHVLISCGFDDMLKAQNSRTKQNDDSTEMKAKELKAKLQAGVLKKIAFQDAEKFIGQTADFKTNSQSKLAFLESFWIGDNDGKVVIDFSKLSSVMYWTDVANSKERYALFGLAWPKDAKNNAPIFFEGYFRKY